MSDRTRTVFYNALALRPGGSGVQTYIREMLAALSPQTSANLLARVQADAVGELPQRVVALPERVSSGARRALDGLKPAPRVDLVHAMDVDLPLGVKVPKVCTLCDMSVFDVPWTFSKQRALGEQLLLRQSLRQADAIICISQFTADRLRAVLDLDGVVIPLAAPSWCRVPDDDEVARVRRKLDLPERFVVQIGTVEPRKGVSTLIEAAREAGLPLLLGGARSESVEGPGVRALGYVDAEDLPAIYRAATVTAYASVYEGFGLPPLEAMACGGAVVSTDVGGVPEAVGDGAILVQSGDASALAGAIRSVADDASARQSLLERAAPAVKAFTWQDNAARTLDVYRDLGVEV